MFKVRIEQKDIRRINRALSRVFRSVVGQQNVLPRDQAFQHTNLLIFNINHQSIIVYKTLNKRYREWKQKYGKGPGKFKYWVLFGDLLKNINTSQTRGMYFSGIRSGIYDTGGKSWLGQGDKGKPKEIGMYASENEKRRPVFGPTENEYAHSADRKKLVEKGARHILRSWR